MREKLFFIFAATSFLAACPGKPSSSVSDDGEASSATDFAFISASDGRIQTLHDLKYAVSMDADFRVTQPTNRVARFDGTPYRISLAAFIGDDSALMIHAEEVADSSGASDYSHLASTNWPDESFRSDGPVCLEIPAEEVDGEHDLMWLRRNGFEPSGSVMYAQYFATTADMNSELVLSILQRVASCAEASADAGLIGRFQAKVSVIRVD